MKLFFKQRFFSWFDSYDIYNEAGETVYTVEGKLSWGHCLHILDAAGNHIGTVKERVLTLLPKFELYENDVYIGSIQKAFTFFAPKFDIDCNGWQVQGSFMEWDYQVTEPCGALVATVTKELFHWTDTYVIDVVNPADALRALMLMLAIDAEKCSRSNGIYRSRGRTHKRPASVISVGLSLKHAVPVGVLSEQRRRFGDGSLPVGGTADQKPSRVRVEGSGGGMARLVGDLHDQPRKV